MFVQKQKKQSFNCFSIQKIPKYLRDTLLVVDLNRKIFDRET